MTVPPLDDVDALLAMAVRQEDERRALQGADEIAVLAIVALSYAGAALAEYRRRAPRTRVDVPVDPREQARMLMGNLVTERRRRLR